MGRQSQLLRYSVWMLGLLALGCTSSEHLAPVSGKVTIKGEALTLGTVVFYPDAAKGNTRTGELRGSLNAQGVYEIKTGDRAGAPLGWYKVAVFALKPPSADDKGQPEFLADPRYQDPEKSGLAVQVVDNPAADSYDFDLRPRE
jgi:hypothetical protein